jgi:hypothetical protein
MKTLTKTIGLVLLLALASSPATATTYKYQDASGNTVYSQNPPENPDTPYEVLGEIRSHARPGSNTPASSAPSSSDSQQEEKADDVIAKTQQDAEKMREQNCTNAKKNLEIFTVTPRVRNEDGEVVRLDDKVRQQKIEEAKQAIRDFCK